MSLKNKKLAELQKLRQQLYTWKDTLKYYRKLFLENDGVIDATEETQLQNMNATIDLIDKTIDEREEKLNFGEKISNKIVEAGDLIVEAASDVKEWVSGQDNAEPLPNDTTAETTTEEADDTTAETTTAETTTEEADDTTAETTTAEADGAAAATADTIEPALAPTSKLSGSVGAGGQNKPQDVVTVRTLLNKFGNNLEITEDGTDSKLIDAIKQFQKDYRGSSNPDGRVDAGGKTWGAMLGIGRIKGELAAIAQEYGVEPAVILAIQSVESGGNGFFEDGRPKILFEGHIFWRELEKKGLNPAALRAGNENIIYQSWTREHYYGGVKEYDRLAEAKKIDEEAALKSASWGEFQIMGFNHDVVGYSDVYSFVEAMHTAGKNQLGSLMGYLKGNNLIRHVQGASKNWAALAKGYNGPSYAVNQYDVKMKAAYDRFSKIL